MQTRPRVAGKCEQDMKWILNGSNRPLEEIIYKEEGAPKSA